VDSFQQVSWPFATSSFDHRSRLYKRLGRILLERPGTRARPAHLTELFHSNVVFRRQAQAPNTNQDLPRMVSDFWFV